MAVRLIRGHWWVDLRWCGRRYRRRSPVDSRGGAEAHAEQLLQWLRYAGSLPTRNEALASASSPSSRLSSFAEEWLRTYVSTNLRANTQRIYGVVMRRHILPFLGDRSIGSLGGRDIELLKASCQAKGLHPKSVNAALSILRRCLTTALDWELIAQLPRFRWLKQPPSPFDHLSPPESARLLSAVRGRSEELMILTALRTGLRLGELRALHWDDIDLDRGFVCVRRSRARSIESAPKNNRIRYVPVSHDLRAALEQAALDRGHVFTDANGAPISETHARKVMHRATRLAKLRRIGWHVLRHTFATQLAAAGVPIQAIQGFLGHATLQMTMRYAHFQPSAFKDAVNLLQANEALSGGVTALGTRPVPGAHETSDSEPSRGFDSPQLLAKNPAEQARSFTWQGR